MIEISCIENLTIKKYEWKYSYYYEKDPSTLLESIFELLIKIEIKGYKHYKKLRHYVIGEKSILKSSSRYCKSKQHEFEIYPNSNFIIVQNIFDAPKFDY